LQGKERQIKEIVGTLCYEEVEKLVKNLNRKDRITVGGGGEECSC
jgi:hypothetical protein